MAFPMKPPARPGFAPIATTPPAGRPAFAPPAVAPAKRIATAPAPAWPGLPALPQEPFRHRRGAAFQAPDEATERADLVKTIDTILRTGRVPAIREANLMGLRGRIASGDLSILDGEDQIARETQFVDRTQVPPQVQPTREPVFVAQVATAGQTGPSPLGDVHPQPAPPNMTTVAPAFSNPIGMNRPVAALPLPPPSEIEEFGTIDPVTGRFVTDADGNPIIAQFVFGLQDENGNVYQYADTPENRLALAGIIPAFTGGPIVYRDFENFDTAGVVVFEGSVPTRLELNTNEGVWDEERWPTQIHETAHTIFELLIDDPEAGPIVESLRPRLYELFAAVNSRPDSDPTFDEIFEYNNYNYADPARENTGRLREGLGEFLRMYALDPAFLYEYFPDLVRAIRPLVNADPRINPYIQLI